MKSLLILSFCTALSGCGGLGFTQRVDVALKSDTSRGLVGNLARETKTSLEQTQDNPAANKEPDKSSPLRDSRTGTSGPYEERDLVVVGFASVAAQTASDPAERKLQAIRASKLDAYQTLAEEVFGVDFRSEYKVVDGKAEYVRIHARTIGKIEGAEVMSIEPIGTDTYQATLKLSASAIRRLKETL